MLGFVMAELQDGIHSSTRGSGSGGSNGQPLPSLDLAELLTAIQAAIKAVAATLRSSGLANWFVLETVGRGEWGGGGGADVRSASQP